MNSDTQTHAAHRAIETLLIAANGGTRPFIAVHIANDRATAVPPFDADNSMDTLFAAVDGNGRLEVAVGIRIDKTTLWHFNFRAARTPGGQFVLLGSPNGRKVHVTVEDDHFYFEDGSPLLTTADEHAATARFDAEFDTLVGGAR